MKQSKTISLFMLLITLMLAISCKKCKEEIPKYTVKGQVKDGTTNYLFNNLSFDVYTQGGAHDKLITKIGNFTTDDSGTFDFTYDQISDKNAKSLSFIGNFFNFESVNINTTIEKVFYKSSLGKLKVVCNLPNITPQDTLFITYAEKNGETRAIDTLTNVANGTAFTYTYFRNEEQVVYWGVGHQQFQSRYYNGAIDIIKANSVVGKVSGDPIIDEVTLKE